MAGIACRAAKPPRSFIWTGKSSRTGTNCRFPPSTPGTSRWMSISIARCFTARARLRGKSSSAFMFAQSKEFPQSRAILEQAAHSGKYFIGAINNEPLELNQYRIEAFDLAARLSGFLQFVLRAFAQAGRD